MANGKPRMMLKDELQRDAKLPDHMEEINLS
jgi:hypothetical protein